jgi:hypothetical protein
MRVHGNQIDANYQANALYGAAKAEAKDAAERVRRRLMSAGLAADPDEAADCVVSLSGDGAQGDEGNRQEAQHQDRPKPNRQAESEKIEDPFSDWA